ncbi:hypothetical protein FRC08_015347 [Ceratobasidium sp. 394]|nr:hypothetical protein FRC08_015347 [Ceratobasidium sp. 394]
MAPNAMISGLLFSFLFSFVLTFNGVMQPYSQLIPFWKWMYRLSPFTYLIEGMVVDGVGGMATQCSSTEIQTLTPLSGQTCQQFMGQYITQAGGYLLNGNDTSNCQFCPQSSSDAYLSSINMSFANRWRDIGLLFAYTAFNIILIYVCTYMFRIRRSSIFGSLRSKLARS